MHFIGSDNADIAHRLNDKPKASSKHQALRRLPEDALRQCIYLRCTGQYPRAGHAAYKVIPHF